MKKNSSIILSGPQGIVFHGLQTPTRWAFAPTIGTTQWFTTREQARAAFNAAARPLQVTHTEGQSATLAPWAKGSIERMFAKLNKQVAT